MPGGLWLGEDGEGRTGRVLVRASRADSTVQGLGDAHRERRGAVVEQVVVEVAAPGDEHPGVDSPCAATHAQPLRGVVPGGVVVAGDEEARNARGRGERGEARRPERCGGEEVGTRGAKRQSGLDALGDDERCRRGRRSTRRGRGCARATSSRRVPGPWRCSAGGDTYAGFR